MRSIRIKASKNYEVLIGSGMLNNCGELIRKVSKARKAVLVCGDIVEGLYADKVQSSLVSAGFEVFRFVYPHGEQSKNLQTFERLMCFMAENRFDRSDIAVALGGGVTGDLTGFAASAYMRGIDFIQIPTTLLAMVDSSVGGKTAVDLPQGKNLVGAFHQPSLVICDTDSLATLPSEVFSEGCAEIIKYAVLCKPDILTLLENPNDNIEQIIADSISIKQKLVEEDEFDKGSRQLLNLGHTIAHAIEKYTDFELPHGNAVAIGLAVICSVALDEKQSNKVISALQKCGLKTDCEYPFDILCQLMLSDKKCSGDEITLVVPKQIGECELKTIKSSELKGFLKCNECCN